jgi:hypothetical protein
MYPPGAYPRFSRFSAVYQLIMKKLLLILYLFARTAHAEWKLNNLNEKYVSYIDSSRTRTEGQYKSVWYMWDYISPQTEATGKQFNSTVAKTLIDCRASKTHTVAIYFYSEAMGKGDVVFSANIPIAVSGWQNPPPNSIGDSQIKVACGKK